MLNEASIATQPYVVDIRNDAMNATQPFTFAWREPYSQQTQQMNVESPLSSKVIC